MAAAGMRWGEVTGVDPESSDSEEEEEVVSAGKLTSGVVW
jgi:hypothetical protein